MTSSPRRPESRRASRSSRRRARDEHGLEALGPYLLPRKTIAFLGSSGVGKSTMINRLLGEERFLTSAVSDAAAGRGRHTTTVRELVRLPGGALLIDTPGLRELQLWADDDGLDRTFDEIDRLAARCRFPDCGHEQEPGCAVRAAVEAGDLDRPAMGELPQAAAGAAGTSSSRRTRRRDVSARRRSDGSSPPGSRKSRGTSRDIDDPATPPLTSAFRCDNNFFSLGAAGGLSWQTRLGIGCGASSGPRRPDPIRSSHCSFSSSWPGRSSRVSSAAARPPVSGGPRWPSRSGPSRRAASGTSARSRERSSRNPISRSCPRSPAASKSSMSTSATSSPAASSWPFSRTRSTSSRSSRPRPIWASPGPTWKRRHRPRSWRRRTSNGPGPFVRKASCPRPSSRPPWRPSGRAMPATRSRSPSSRTSRPPWKRPRSGCPTPASAPPGKRTRASATSASASSTPGRCSRRTRPSCPSSSSSRSRPSSSSRRRTISG